MFRRTVATLAAILAVSAVAATSASASTTQAPVIVEQGIYGWEVLGSLTAKKLNQAVVLPKGSYFEGEGNFTSLMPIKGKLTGQLHVPPFTASLALLGLVPTEVGVTFTQVGQAEGTVVAAPLAQCPGAPEGAICATFHIPAKANLGITMLGTLGLKIVLVEDHDAFAKVRERLVARDNAQFRGGNTCPASIKRRENAFTVLGRAGGHARAAKLSAKQRVKIARKAIRARWSKARAG